MAVFARVPGFGMLKTGSLAALAVCIWLLGAYGQSRPDALGPDAPATRFSAARASAALGRVLGAEVPHPVGSPQNAQVQTRLLQELAAMGVQARSVRQMSCYSEMRWGAVECATVTNIIAGVTPGPKKSKDDKIVLLMAHRDSVAAGPGACDDGCGVATLLETIRALKARGTKGAHPIVALFTDGEEAGLLGAAAYLRDPLARARTGVVINVEARGNQGPSFLFQTSAGNAGLIDLYARALPRFATSSLYGEIYKFLPNDTDLTPFLHAGIPGYNFAVIGNEAHYHTALDRRANIDPRSLQQHGDNALELAQTLANADFAGLKQGDAIYLDVLGRWLPRLPVAWGLPLSILVFIVIGLAGFYTPRDRREVRRPWLAALMPPLFLAGSIGIGFGLHWIAAAISGHAQPAYANPLWLRLSLAFGVFAVALPAARGAGVVGSWLWFAALAVACAIFAPGVTPYFLFPALVAAPLLLVSMRGGRDVAAFIAALAAMVIWLGLCALTEPLLGIDTHPLFTVTAAFGLMTLLPLLGKAREGWGLALAFCVVAALGLAVTAGFQPAFSSAKPQRLDIKYAEQGGKAWWLASPVADLPPSLRAVAGFSARPQRRIEMAYAAPAGAARNRAPQATVTRHGDDVTLDLNAPGDGVMLLVPEGVKLQSVTLGGITVPAPPRRVSIVCATQDCGNAQMTLRLGSSTATTLTLLSLKHGLPPDGTRLLKARPVTAVASQEGDQTVLAATVAIPARQEQ
jgi:hypothetical protein